MICLFCSQYTLRIETIGMRSAKHSSGPVSYESQAWARAIGVYLERIGHCRQQPARIWYDLGKGVGPELEHWSTPRAWIGLEGRLCLLYLPFVAFSF